MGNDVLVCRKHFQVELVFGELDKSLSWGLIPVHAHMGVMMIKSNQALQ